MAYAKFENNLAGVAALQDHDSVFTSYDWLRALVLEAGFQISYSERGARDNPRIESFWAHCKGEDASLFMEA